MSVQSVIVIYLKELKDILRDRRTLFSMILFPILLFPLIYLGMGAFMKSRMDDLKSRKSIVAWIEQEEASDLRTWVAANTDVEILPGVTDTTSALEMLRDKDIHTAVLVPDDFNSTLIRVLEGDESAVSPNILLFVNETRQTSEFAGAKVMQAVREYRTNLVTEALFERGLRKEIIRPFDIDKRNIASSKEMGGHFVGVLLPYIVILMVLTGAMYPAIDLTAGEKERGTLETLLVAGVSRVDIVFGKFFTVLTAALVTAALSMGSLALTITIGLKLFKELGEVINIEIGPDIILILILVILPLAVIFSSLLMTISLFAKSYREAQSYISPLMILVIVPSMASMVPDIELSTRMAFIPVMNVSLILKEAFAGGVEFTYLFLVMGINFFYAAIGLFLVLRMFRKESVLFRS